MADGAWRVLCRRYLSSFGSLLRGSACSGVLARRQISSLTSSSGVPMQCGTSRITGEFGRVASRAFGARWHGTAQDKTLEASKKEFISGYEEIPELQNAPENVKRIFHLSNANQLERRKVAKKEIKQTFQGKEKEKHIAELTLKINTLCTHCEDKPKDKHNKVFLQWLTDQRQKKLKALKASQFEHYLALIRRLNIPPIESPHSKYNQYKFTKFKLGVEVKKKQNFLERKMIK